MKPWSTNIVQTWTGSCTIKSDVKRCLRFLFCRFFVRSAVLPGMQVGLSGFRFY